MKTAELLSGTDGAYLFHYFTKDEFKTLTIYVSEYQSGTLISKSKVADLDYDGIDSPSRGVIAVVPDFESFKAIYNYVRHLMNRNVRKIRER